MSRFLKDSAERYFQKTAKLMQKEEYNEALKEIQKAQNIVKELNEQEYILIFSSLKGHILYLLGRYEESLEIHTFGLKFNEEILSRDPYNKIYESAFTVSFLDVFALGNIFYNKGQFFRAKDCYEIYLLISQRLLKANPKNLSYLSDMAMAQNNLGALLRYSQFAQFLEELEPFRGRQVNVIDAWSIKEVTVFTPQIAFGSYGNINIPRRAHYCRQ